MTQVETDASRSCGEADEHSALTRLGLTVQRPNCAKCGKPVEKIAVSRCVMTFTFRFHVACHGEVEESYLTDKELCVLPEGQLRFGDAFTAPKLGVAHPVTARARSGRPESADAVKSAVGQSPHPLNNPPVDLDSVKIGEEP